MINNTFLWKGIRKYALLWALVLSGCGGYTGGGGDGGLGGGGVNDGIPAELVGNWYDSQYQYAFEITAAGEGYIAPGKTQCTVSVSGSTVSFRDSGNTLAGSFSYSIKNGELTIAVGTRAFKDLPSVSPLRKAGSIPSGGTVPVELIGRWYAKTNPPALPNFEIALSGGMTISGEAAQYTAVVTGNKISVLEGSILRGAFQYSFMYGEMIVTNGTDVCAGLEVLSPFVKAAAE